MSLTQVIAKQALKLNRCVTLNNIKLQIRLKSYQRSEPVGDPSLYTDYEIIHNPKEWMFVERLLPKKWIPEIKPKESYPSGWMPQRAKSSDLPYFVERTKNHMIPVYLRTKKRGLQRITRVRNVEGDIWKLCNELINYLKPATGKITIGAKVDEMKKSVFLRGDYVEYVKKFLTDRGL